MKFGVHQIVQATRGTAMSGPSAALGPVLTDTRAELDGAWFLALRGARFDAHEFALGALEKGAVGGVFSEQVPGWDAPWVRVDDTTVALQDLGRAARARLSGPVIGLTGSSGKTTTRTMVSAALAQMGAVHQTAGNLNNHLGVPMTLLAAPESSQATVLEMGTSSPGEIAFLADLGRPDVRMVVNVGPAHLEELGGLDGVAREKRSIYAGSKVEDRWIVNVDDPRLRDVGEGRERTTWGWHPSADVRLVEVAVDAEAWVTRARFATPQGEVTASLPGPGAYLAHNAGAALAVATSLGLDLSQSAADLARVERVGMRLARVELEGDVVAINDAYNANPTSMKAALDTLAAVPGRRWAVLGDMLELGSSSAAWHEDVARYAASLDLHQVVLVGEQMASVPEDVAPRAWRAATPAEAAERMLADLRAGDRLLLKASRGARLERVLDTLNPRERAQ